MPRLLGVGAIVTALGICGYAADHMLAHAPEVVAEEADAPALEALEG